MESDEREDGGRGMEVALDSALPVTAPTSLLCLERVSKLLLPPGARAAPHPATGARLRSDPASRRLDPRLCRLLRPRGVWIRSPPCTPVRTALIWNCGFPYDSRLVGFVKDYRKSSDRGARTTGTPQFPRRTITLEHQLGATCWGIAYKIREEDNRLKAFEVIVFFEFCMAGLHFWHYTSLSQNTSRKLYHGTWSRSKAPGY
ncbi:hypothetical protein U9M48_028769 [Paspalum notatum var. saurae]|uniref:glutathione-specific gamma-glutamylcyclotransferase n=1 Tax=Paspalum notatum var. saurae TaxID=547442 RepID=A0AAQ3X0J5_PASNO